MYNLATKTYHPVAVSSIFDSFFDDVFNDSVFLRPKRLSQLSNVINSNSFYNVEETEQEIDIKVNIPSFDENLSKKDIDVSYENGVLTIRHDSSKKDSASKTNTPNKFYLQYAVKDSQYEIDSSNIGASLNGNILTIKLPKANIVNKNQLKIEVK